MIPFLMMGTGALSAVGPQPVVSNVAAASSNAGQCNGTSIVTSATITVSWSMANQNANYTTKLYENGSLVATLANTVTSWIKTLTGIVENGVRSPFDANWTYRIDVVRNSDNVVVSTATSAAFTDTYGQCGSSFQ